MKQPDPFLHLDTLLEKFYWEFETARMEPTERLQLTGLRLIGEALLLIAGELRQANALQQYIHDVSECDFAEGLAIDAELARLKVPR